MEITDATNFKKTLTNIDPPLRNKEGVLSLQYNLIGSSKKDFDREPKLLS